LASAAKAGRPWQVRALERFSQSRDFLAVATPGAGKTTFALAAARAELGADPQRRVMVVAPTAHLKVQWAEAGARFGLHLDPDWSSSARPLPADMHGVVVTYQQVAAANRSGVRRCRSGA
jgi:superfamily II DNA or RNA helicase